MTVSYTNPCLLFFTYLFTLLYLLTLCLGWIAAVSGDVHKARCLYCRMLVSAHYKDLKYHARTAKHAHNVALNQPGCVADPGKPVEKSLLNRKRAFGPPRPTRFGLHHSMHYSGLEVVVVVKAIEYNCA